MDAAVNALVRGRYGAVYPRATAGREGNDTTSRWRIAAPVAALVPA
jgi:hypothetical protein